MSNAKAVAEMRNVLILRTTGTRSTTATLECSIIPRMPMLTIALIGKPNAEGIGDHLVEIAEFISQEGHRVVFERDTSAALPHKPQTSWSAAEIGQQADLAVVVGGDGTMLGIARQLAPFQVPMVGINHGRVGFMTDIPFKDTRLVLAEILAGHYEVEERTLLRASIARGDEVILNALALNDVVVARGAVSGMVELTVDVDGRFMYSQRSDGLIIAAPTGSTAYALSASGPILHPRLAGIMIVPIAPHSLSNRPIVLPDTCKIDVTVTAGREVTANFDMQSFTALQHGDRVSVERAPMPIQFLHPVGYSYFATLRQKLHWNEHPVGANERPSTLS
jgi:NAD+ kinase